MQHRDIRWFSLSLSHCGSVCTCIFAIYVILECAHCDENELINSPVLIFNALQLLDVFTISSRLPSFCRFVVSVHCKKPCYPLFIQPWPYHHFVTAICHWFSFFEFSIVFIFCTSLGTSLRFDLRVLQTYVLMSNHLANCISYSFITCSLSVKGIILDTWQCVRWKTFRRLQQHPSRYLCKYEDNKHILLLPQPTLMFLCHILQLCLVYMDKQIILISIYSVSSIDIPTDEVIRCASGKLKSWYI